jgi:hypothetical protein
MFVGSKQLEGYNEIDCISFGGSDLDDRVSFGGNPQGKLEDRAVLLCALQTATAFM